MKTQTPACFCVAPWRVLHISPQGDVRSCYESEINLGNIHDTSVKSLLDIWHGDQFVSLRQRMLNGETSDQCRKCLMKSQAISGNSLRTLLNETIIGKEITDQDFSDGKTRPSLLPILLDLSFSNRCNLKCRMCGPYYSSSWAREPGPALSESFLQNHIFPLISPALQKIVVAGGEPFLDPIHKLFLRNLVEKKLISMEIEYNSNGTVIDQELIDLWHNFPRIKVSLSLDEMGERFEYLRKGSRWSQVEENLRQLRSAGKNVTIACYSTITVFNLWRFPDFLKYILENKLFTLDEINFHYLVTPEYYSIQILPKRIKEEIKLRYYQFMSSYLLKNYDLTNLHRLIVQLKMLINYMFQEDQSQHVASFLNMTSQLDRQRGESFLHLFPELQHILGLDTPKNQGI